MESAPGQGSTFWFTAHFAKHDLGSAPPVRGERQPMPGLHVLIVDDNATNRTILNRQLLSWGMRNDCAEEGAGALALLRAAVAANDPYDLAILDMQMPEMDGLGLAAAIQAEPSLAGMRLVMLTSIGHHVGPAARDAGILATLTKPVRQSQLYDCLSGVMNALPIESTALRDVPMPPLVTPVASGIAPVILLAEDNDVNQRVAGKMLQRLGYRVVTVGTGRLAVEAVLRERYAAVLMDCQMPELDGYAATGQIRDREGDGWRLPIIAMTANALAGDRERCLEAGMDDYLPKPVRADALDKVLARWVRRGDGAAIVQPAPAPGGEAGTAAPDALDAPPLDGQALRGLRDLGDGDEFVDELIALFLAEAPGRIAAMRFAVGIGAAQGLEREAHTLRGSAANLGAVPLADLCQELQATGGSGQLGLALALLAQLEGELARVTAALIAYQKECEPACVS